MSADRDRRIMSVLSAVEWQGAMEVCVNLTGLGEGWFSYRQTMASLDRLRAEGVVERRRLPRSEYPRVFEWRLIGEPS